MTKTFRISLLFLTLLLLFSLAACSGQKAPAANSETSDSLPADTEPTHVHDGGTAWKLDLNSHWKICSCGEILEKTDHQWIEDTRWIGQKDCDVCKVAYTNKDDAYLMLTLHDSYYCILYQFYTMDGVLEYTEEFNYTYVEGEAPLYEEYEYRMVVYGEEGNILQLSTSYVYERGDKTEALDLYYDESGEIIKTREGYSVRVGNKRDEHTTTTDANGKVLETKDVYTYYNDDGSFADIHTYINGKPL